MKLYPLLVESKAKSGRGLAALLSKKRQREVDPQQVVASPQTQRKAEIGQQRLDGNRHETRTATMKHETKRVGIQSMETNINSHRSIRYQTNATGLF
jgi:hypothetical protein